jgi:hypothetical protein
VALCRTLVDARAASSGLSAPPEGAPATTTTAASIGGGNAPYSPTTPAPPRIGPLAAAKAPEAHRARVRRNASPHITPPPIALRHRHRVDCIDIDRLIPVFHISRQAKREMRENTAAAVATVTAAARSRRVTPHVATTPPRVGDAPRLGYLSPPRAALHSRGGRGHFPPKPITPTTPTTSSSIDVPLTSVSAGVTSCVAVSETATLLQSRPAPSIKLPCAAASCSETPPVMPTTSASSATLASRVNDELDDLASGTTTPAVVVVASNTESPKIRGPPKPRCLFGCGVAKSLGLGGFETTEQAMIPQHHTRAFGA